MNFSSYWIILITVILVLISIYNIAKMIVFLSKHKYPKIDKDDSLNSNIRNLLVSVALLSVVSLVYIILVFSKLG